MKAFKEIPKIAHEIAHKYCEGRWIAVGGGGYDIWRVVPRAWSYIWLEMTENNTPLSDLPLDWIEKWQPFTKDKLPPTWEDDEQEYQSIPRQAEITEKNQQTLDKALYPIRNNEQ